MNFPWHFQQDLWSVNVDLSDAAGNSGSGNVTVPDAHLLFSGTYERLGLDLAISDPDHRVVIHDYFRGEKRPALVSPDGAPIDSRVVDALTGHQSFAQAGGDASAAKVIGRVVTITGSASVVRNGVTVELSNNDVVYQSDVVQTGSASKLGLVLIDGTTFNLSENARFMLNDLTYEPTSNANGTLVSLGSGSDHSLFTLVQGAASFVAGQVAKTGDMQVTTPVAAIGVRGTAVLLDINSVDGKVSISVADQHDGQVHSVQVFKCDPTATQSVCTAGEPIGIVASNGPSLTLTPAGNFQVTAQEMSKGPAQIAQEFSTFQQVLATYDIGKQLAPNTPPPSDGKRGDANPQTLQKFAGSPPPFPSEPPTSVIAEVTGQSGSGSITPLVAIVSIDIGTPTKPVLSALDTTQAVILLSLAPPTISSPGGPVNQANQTISGTVDVAYVGTTVTLFDTHDGVTTELGTATVGPGGVWTKTVALAGDGAHSIVAQNIAANITMSAPVVFTLDTTAPVVEITSAGGPTNHAMQTISGTVDAADAGATVTILDGSTVVGTALVQGNGNWSTIVTLASGPNSLAARVSDAAGNTATSSAVVYTLSTTGPTVTEALTLDTGTSATDHVTSNPAVSGTGLANTVVHFTIDGSPVAATVTADAQGAWSFTPTGLTDGPHSIVASQTDAFGNTGSASLSFTLDTTAPSGGIPDLTVGSDTGSSSTDNVTSATAPTFTVALNPSVAAGDTVQLLLGGAPLAHPVTHVITTAEVLAGSVALAVSASDLGADGGKQVTAQFSDAAGNSSTSSALSFTLDTTAPAVAITSAGGATNQAAQTISGTGEAGTTVTLFDNGIQLQLPTVTVGQNGVWSANVTLTNGSNALTAQVADLAGNTATSTPVVFTLSTTGPTLTESLAFDTGTSPLDHITSNDALSGTGLANTVVHFTIDGSPVAATVTADAQGAWSLTPTGLTDGPHTIVASQTDAFGNTGTASLSFTLDTGAPVVTITSAGGATNQASQTITGTVGVADAGAIVTILDGTTTIGTALVQGNGTWSTTVTLTNGPNSLTARVSDAAGNTATSSAVVYTLSTTGPTVTETLVSDTGTSSTDHVTANPAVSGTGLANTVVHFTIDGSPVAATVTADAQGAWSFTPTGLADGPHSIVASQTDAFGNTGTASLGFTLDATAPTVAITSAGGATNQASQTISGTGEADSTVTLFDNGIQLQLPTVTVGQNGGWSANVTLTNGSNALTAQVADLAGNTATSSAVVYTLSTTGPTVTEALTVDTGTLATDHVTSNPAVSGTGLANAVVHFTIDGSPIAATVTADAQGAWSFMPTGLTDGPHSIVASQTDAFGNTGSASLSFTLDTTVPTGGTPDLTAGSDTGSSTTDNITAATAPSFTVALNPTVAAGDTVQLLLNGAPLVHPVSHVITAAEVSATSVTLAVAAGDLGADGAKTIAAQFSDAAGNSSTTAALTVTLDTTAPSVAITNLGGATNQPNQTITGTADPGAAVTILDGSNVVGTVLVPGTGNWSSPVTLSTGSNALTATVSDAAGNLGTSNTVTYTLNTTVPTGGTPDLVAGSDSGVSSTDNITNVTAPTFTVALGANVVAGDTVELLLNGAPFSHPLVHTVSSADLTAQSVSFTVSAGDLGIDGVKQISAQLSDAFNNSSTTAVLIITLDTTAPAAVATVTALSSDTGSSNSDFVTSTGAQTVSGTYTGTLGTGETIQVSADGGTTWVTASPSGTTWSASGVTLSAGTGTLSVRTIDLAGNATTGTGHSYTLDATAPTAVATVTALSSDTGSSTSDFVTSAGAQTVSGTFTGTLGTGETIQVSADGGATWVLANPSGTTWSASGVTLSAGSGTLAVRTIDLAGNATAGTGHSYTLDTTTPSGGTPVLTAASDSGTSQSDGITDVTNPTFTVALNPTVAVGDTVQLLLGGVALAHNVTHTINSTDLLNGSISLTVTSGDLGADGSKSITAKFIDTAGNSSTTSADVITLDTTAPVVTIGSTGGNTNQSTQTISGTGEVGATVNIYDNGGATSVATTTVLGNGSWSANVSLGSGSNSFIAKATDAAGNSGSSNTVQFTLNAVGPTGGTPVLASSSDSGASNSDDITNVTALTFTVALGATVVAGDTVQLLLNNSPLAHPVVQTVTSTDISNGLVSLTVTAGDLGSDGSKSISAQLSDSFGNSNTTAALVVTLDSTAPTVIATVTALSSDTGSSTSDFVTSAGSQTASGTFTGTLNTGETIQVSGDGGTTWVTANPSGTNWSASGVTLSAGSGTLSVRTIDLAGNTTTGTGHSYTLDSTAPTAIATVTALSSDTGSSTSDFVTSAGAQTVSGTFTGTLNTGETIQVSADGGTTWVTASPSGTTWSASGVTLSAGTGTLSVRTIDLAGNATAGTGHSYTLDATAPTAVATVTALSSDTGSSNRDFVTSTGAQTVSGTFTGTLNTGETIQVSADGGATWVTASPSGSTWSASGVTLSAGSGTLSVRTIDLAGNATAGTGHSYTLDQTAPSGGTPDLVAASDSGISSTDNITNVLAPTFSVSLGSGVAVGDTVQLLLNGAPFSHPLVHAVSSADLTAQSVSFTVSAGDLGIDGVKQLSALFTDAAGNSTTGSALSVTLDTSAPVVTINTAGGNTNQAAQTISGTGEAGTTVTLSDNGTALQLPTITVDQNGLWSANVTLSTGGNLLTAQATDLAGNLGTSNTVSYTLSTNAPTGGTPDLVAGSDSGVSSTDNVTNVTAPTFTVALGANVVAGDTVELLLNGAPFSHPLVHTVSSADLTAQSVSFTVSAGDLGIDGVKQISAQLSDAFNNSSTTAVLIITLDTTAPAAVATVTALSSDTGSSTSDFVTSAGAQTVSGTFTGTLNTGETIQVSADGGTTWVTASPSGTTWSASGVTLSAGTGTLSVRTIDLAGNATAGTGHSYTLDATAPTAVATVTALSSDTGSSTSDFVTSAGAQTVSGTFTGTLNTGETIQVSADGGTTWVTASPSGSTWSASGVTLSAGSGALSVRTIDLAGNTTTGTGHSYTLDSTSPTAVATVTALSADTGSSTNDFVTSTGAQTVSGTFTGTLNTGETIQVSADGGATWVTANPSGSTWSASGVTLPAGSGTLAVRTIDLAGNATAGTGHSYTLDTTAPSGGTPDLVAAADSGVSSTDNITNVTAPSFTVALNPTVAAGDTVQLLLNGAPLAHPVSHVITAAEVSATSVTLAVAAGDLGADGAKTIAAQFSDAAGNSSTTAALTVTLDTTAPSVAITSLGGATNQPNQTITGTADPGAAVTILDGSNVVGTVLVPGTGNWSSPVTLSTGSNALTATVSDAAGNLGTSNTVTYTLNTTVPTGGTPDLVTAADSGVSSTDNITNVTAPSFTVALGSTVVAGDTVELLLNGASLAHPVLHTVTAAEVSATSVTLAVTAGDLGADGSKAIAAKFSDGFGNSSTSTALTVTLDTTVPTGGTPDLTAGSDTGSSTTDNITNATAPSFTVALNPSVAAGDSVQLLLNGAPLAHPVLHTVTAAEVTATSVTLAVTAGDLGADGAKQIAAQFSDAAGNSSTTAALTVTLDTTAPSVALAITAIASDSGTAGDFVTNDTTLTVSGTNAALGSGEKIQVSSDGGTTWADVTPSTSTSWSYFDPATHATSFTYQVRIVDTAGNLGTTASQAVTIDTTAPSEPVAIESVAASSAPTSTSFTVSGTNGVLQNGDKVQISTDGTTWTDVLRNGPTRWTFSDTTVRASSFTYFVRVVDSAGNVGATASQAVLAVNNGGTVTLAGSPVAVEFAGTGGTLQIGIPGVSGTINAVSVANGPVAIGGNGDVTALVGDAIDLYATGANSATPADLTVNPTGAITGAGTGISVTQNSSGSITVTTSGPVVGLSGRGILAQQSATGTGSILVNGSGSVTGGGSTFSGIVAVNLNAANNSNITISQSGDVIGGYDGIRVQTNGNGDEIITTGTNATIAGLSLYGIEAQANGTGSISIVTGSGGIITSASAGINAYNQATAIPQIGGVTESSISVTAYGTIDSGATYTGSGAKPAGILAGYRGGTSSTSNANVFGNVTIDNFADITALGGDGIRGYEYGTGNVNITDEPNSFILAPDEFGIRGENYGSGNITITTSSGDSITSGAGGISAVNFATAIAGGANSSITVVAHGSIDSGTNLNPSGSQPAGITAVYYGANGSVNNSINGTISVDNFADITAAAGSGIIAVNYGNGLVTVTEEARTSIAGAQYGISASSLGNASGGVVVNVLSDARISAGALHGIVGILANSSNSSNISIMTSSGDIITAGGRGISANSAATSAPSSSQISITAAGTINSGYNIGPGFTSQGGIWAGYNNNGSTAVNFSIAGSVIIDSSATINAAVGAGVGMYNFGVGNESLTLETTSVIDAPFQGVSAFAQGGGNVTIQNKGTITSVNGTGIATGTGGSLSGAGNGTITVTNSGVKDSQGNYTSGVINALGAVGGGSITAVVQINNASTQGATFTNSGLVVAGLYAASSSLNLAVSDYYGGNAANNGSVTITNSGTISGNVSLNSAPTSASSFQNQSGGIWNVRGQNFFNGTGSISNSGTINLAGISAFNTGGSLTITNLGLISAAALGFARISGAIAGTGTINIGDQARIEFVGAVSGGQTVSFGGHKGTLVLDDPINFGGAISGLAAGDIMTLQGTTISSATADLSTLTINQSSGSPLHYTVSGALSQNTFAVLTGNTIVLLPNGATSLTGAIGAQSFSPSTAQSFQLSGAAITSNSAIGLNIAASDGSSSDTIFAELNQFSSIAVTGSFSGMNVTTAGANIAVISAAGISSSGGIGLFTNSGTGSTTIVDYGNVSGTLGIEAVTSGAGSSSIVINGPAIVTGTSAAGIFALTSAGSASVTTMPGSKINAAGAGIVVESQGTSVPLANNSSLTVQAAGTINSGQVAGSGPAAILVGYMGGSSSPSTVPNPPLTGIFGNIIIDSAATITAFTGSGIGAFNYGTGDISVSNTGAITATAAGTTSVDTAQYGIAAFNYGAGNITVVGAVGSNINSGSAGILASNYATVVAASTPTSVNVTSLGTVISGTNLTGNGSAPAGIIANINPGGAGTYNGNVYGNISVTAASVTANAGTGIRAGNYGIGDVVVNLLSNATIVALNSASTSSSSAPYGVNAYGFGAGNVTVTMSSGDTINSGSDGINANNQATAIAADAAALVTVNAVGSINSGDVRNFSGSAPAAIRAGFLGGTSTVANLNVNGTVIINNAASVSAAAGNGINAYNFGSGDVVINNTGNVSVTGSSTRASSTATVSTEAAEYGIVASSQSGGTGNVAINLYSGNVSATSASTTITNPVYGVYALNKGSGDISVYVASSSSTITSSGVGINAVNEASAIAASSQSSIVVTSYAKINSGTVVTGTGSPPAGILAGYLGGTTIPAAYPLPGLYGDVVVNNFGNITAASGDGIRAYNFGSGDVTVNHGAGTIIVQGASTPNGYGDGIRATNSGPGNVSVTTAAGTVIDAHLGGSGIFAANIAPAPLTSTVVVPATSTVAVIAKGSISSGTIPTGTGDPSAGILAGYNPNGGSNTVDSNVQGNVLIDDYANVTAAAGTDGIRGFNYGIGSVTIITEVGATITGGRYGLGGFAWGGGNVSITNHATVTATSAAIDAEATGTGTVLIDNFGSVNGAIVVGTTTTTLHNETGASWTATGSNLLPVSAELINDGTITLVGGSSLTVMGLLDGAGQINISSGAALSLQGAVATTTTQSITFQGSGTLTLSSAELDSDLNFVPVIGGLDPTNEIDFVGSVTSAFWNSGVLTLMNGAAAVAYLHLVGDYSTAGFTVTTVNGISHIVDPPVSSLVIADGETLDLSAPTFDKVSFEGSGTLVLEQPESFHGQIADFSIASDILTLRGFDATQTTAKAVYNAQNDTTQLTVTDASDHHSVSLILDGNAASTTFSVSADPNGGIDIAGSPDAGMIARDANIDLNHASSNKIAFEAGSGSFNFISDDHGGTLIAEWTVTTAQQDATTSARANHDQFIFNFDVLPRPAGGHSSSVQSGAALDKLASDLDHFGNVDFSHSNLTAIDMLIGLNPDAQYMCEQTLTKMTALSNLHASDFVMPNV